MRARRASCTLLLATLIIQVAAFSSRQVRASLALSPTGSAQGIVPAHMSVEPADGIRAVVRAINHAQTRIFLETYILTDVRLVHALERAEAEGVEVYVLLEHHPLGMGLQPDHMADSLRAAGIGIRWTRAAFLLTHAKFMVLDDRLALVGTANFSRSAFTRNREAIVFDRNRLDVHEISNLFRADWDGIPATVRDSHLLISPDNSRSMLSALLAGARRSLDIYAEEVADPKLENLLIRRARAGIRVRLIAPWAANPEDIRRLRRGDVAVREMIAPYIHAKVIVVDGRLAFVGSENFSPASLDRNRELGVLLRGGAVQRLSHVFANDWRRARTPPLR